MYCKEENKVKTNKKRSKRITMKKLKKQVKGITLIALVVTIIVLLILAGIALNLTIGENGLFTRAQNAANTWQLAEQNEQNAMNSLASWMDSVIGSGNGQGTGGDYNTATTVADAIHQNKFFKENTTIKDDLQNVVKVPEGFKIAQDSGTKVENGIVIEDKDGNQFVWIPAKTGEGVTVHTTKGDKTIEYTRTAYSSNVATGETDSGTNSEKIKSSSSSSDYYTEALPTDEADSVNSNGGYYIGRFEAGDKESSEIPIEERSMRTSSSSQENNITIKKDQVPYNYITRANCKTLAEEMASVQKYSAKTKLVSSYAWDTAISFMQITNEDYGNSSEEGNYYDTTFSYTDITGAEQTKNKNSNTLVPTGQTTAVCNIYDMGGNLYEYTTESYSATYGSCTNRGGSCNGYYADTPAGNRFYSGGVAYGDSGFRLTLYVQ